MMAPLYLELMSLLKIVQWSVGNVLLVFVLVSAYSYTSLKGVHMGTV